MRGHFYRVNAATLPHYAFIAYVNASAVCVMRIFGGKRSPDDDRYVTHDDNRTVMYT